MRRVFAVSHLLALAALVCYTELYYSSYETVVTLFLCTVGGFLTVLMAEKWWKTGREATDTKAKIFDMAVTAVLILGFFAILLNQGVTLYVLLLVAPLVLALYSKFTIPKSKLNPILTGVFYGVVMAFVAVVSVIITSQILGVNKADLAQLSTLSIVLSIGPAVTLLVVALPEELSFRFLYFNAATQVAGSLLPAFFSTTFFIFMHAPTRLAYGTLGLVALAIITVVTLILVYGYIRECPTPLYSITAHTVYNSILGFFASESIVEVLVGLLVLALIIYMLKGKISREEVKELEAAFK